jgi:predicted phage terminase large subunit-like protein
MNNNIPKNPITTSERDAIIERMLHDEAFRYSVVTDSHAWFFYYYFSHYIKAPMAPFHHDMFVLTENANISNAIIMAFRGSAKSTIFTLSLPIWAILGKQQIKHIVLISSTQQKAQLLLQHIKHEFESNRALQMDLGPFKEERNEWNTISLYVPKYDAKITAASVEQSVRGMRFKEHRPQLILIDDMEDLESVKTLESRNKIDNWLMGEVIPAGEEKTRLFVVGNLLHRDSVIKRLENRIVSGKMSGVRLVIPFFDKDGKPAWPGRFPDQAAVDIERTKGMSEVAWKREYELQIIPEEDQIVHEEWLKCYDQLPSMDQHTDYRFAMSGVDLAISEKETADFTSVVSVQVFGYGKDRKIYVLPNPINERLDSPTAVERVNMISRALGNGVPTKVVVEDVGYQRAHIQYLQEKEIPAEGVVISGHDKRSRLQLAATLIQSGAVLFPRHGCEELLLQILGFGVEKHDDLVDAFTLIILKLVKEDGENGRYTVLPPYGSTPSPTTREGQEREADELLELQQRIARGDTTAWPRYNELTQKQRRDYWKNEERNLFNRRRY